MAKRYQFQHTNILLVDPDRYIAQAIMQNLRVLGFTRVTHVGQAQQASKVLETMPINFMVTEWELPDKSGIDMVHEIRTSHTSPNRLLPIIMLTGRGELPDVRKSRDTGITEFVVKPFSPQTLYSRIEQMVDNPRGFVLSENYTGPERRRRVEPPYGVGERRNVVPAPIADKQALKTTASGQPQIIAPSFALKQSLGITEPLSRLITPEILKEAQKELDNMAESSLEWIQKDVTSLRDGLARLLQLYSVAALESIKTAALSIKSRAGTFGYSFASDVARQLYLFLSADFIPTHPHHLTVISKHIDVMQVIFAQKITQRAGVGEELITDLQRLITMKK